MSTPFVPGRRWTRLSRPWPSKTRAVQNSGLGNGEELSLLDKLLLQPRLGNHVGASVEPPKRPLGSNVILCRPFRDSILLPGLTRHFRAGLLIVPSLWDWPGCFDKLVWSWATLWLFNLKGQIELSKKLAGQT
jgi:hypothetical protein